MITIVVVLLISTLLLCEEWIVGDRGTGARVLLVDLDITPPPPYTSCIWHLSIFSMRRRTSATGEHHHSAQRNSQSPITHQEGFLQDEITILKLVQPLHMHTLLSLSNPGATRRNRTRRPTNKNAVFCFG